MMPSLETLAAISVMLTFGSATVATALAILYHLDREESEQRSRSTKQRRAKTKTLVERLSAEKEQGMYNPSYDIV